MNVNISTLEITDGFIGSMGKVYKTPTEAEFERAIAGAMQMNGWTRERVLFALDTGSAVQWCKSPNYTADHQHGVIRPKAQARSAETFVCEGCGRRFPVSQMMNASHGTACRDCYDSLSDD